MGRPFKGTDFSINEDAFAVNSDAVAFSVLQYAMNTQDINGVRGKGNFKLPDLPLHDDQPVAE